ncbi:MAG: glycosyltransferase family 4 protein [Acidilobus sp.]|nr:glycosyltransferase family 4 protein [Acidilobus sp.]
MRVALVHAMFDLAGGAENLTLNMYRALRELGHEVDLYAAHVDERAWRTLADGAAGAPRPIIVGEPVVNRLIPIALTLRILLAMPYLGKRLKRLKPDYDLIIDTYATVPVPWADASYVHFPARCLLGFLSRHRRLQLHERLYYRLIAWMAKRLADSTRPVMTNSSWTAEYVRRAYGSQRVYVVHPPVNVEELSSIGGDRGKVVLTVSRIAPEKMVAEIPKVARLVPEAEFYLVGSTSDYSERTLKVIESEAEGLSNFHLETNVSRRRILELMSQASIYLHPPYAEHFGIAIAEAAAAGLVPVVYRDGGGWTDIVSRIDEGLGYTSVEEAASTIKSLLNDPERLKGFSAKAREVAKGFSYEKFKGRLNEVIRGLARVA